MTAEDKSTIDPQATDGEPDRLAIRELYEQHGVHLVRFCTSMLRDRTKADEVVQTVFRRAIEHYDSVQTNFRGWLFQVAANEVALLKRKQTRESEVLSQAVWEISARRVTADSGVGQDLESEERSAAVRQAISELSHEHQQIVRERIYENKKFAVIAEELGIPLGTALTRMRSAMQKLEKLLAKHRDE